MKLKEAVYEHYLPAKRKTRRGNTVYGYESALRLHVVPRFGECEMRDIKHRDVQEWVDGFELPGSAEKAYKTLRQVVRWYKVKFRDRMDDPTFGVEFNRPEPPHQPVFDRSQLKAFLKGIRGHELEAVCICQLDMGLRKCEAFGLRWDDIDLETRQVRIERGRQVVRGEVVTYPPKTRKSRRVLFLTGRSARRLKVIRRERGDGGYLTDVRPDKAARQLKRYCRDRLIPWVPMKNFRHTYATLAIERGMPIESLARILGHTDITMAYERYIRADARSMKRRMSRRLHL